MANWQYYLIVRILDFVSIYTTPYSAMISLLQFQNFTNLTHVLIFRKSPSLEGIKSTVSSTKVANFERYLQVRLKSGNSRKSVRWSAVPAPCLSSMGLKLKRKQGVAPKGSTTYAFTHMGDSLLLLLLLHLLLRPLPLNSQS